MKIIQPGLHGILDYGTVIFLCLSPWLFSFEHAGSMITYSIAAWQFVLSIVTDYPAGIFRKLPFLLHGFIELAMSFTLAIIAIWFTHQGLNNAKLVYWCLAVIYLSVFLLTNFSKADRKAS